LTLSLKEKTFIAKKSQAQEFVAKLERRKPT